MNEGLDQIRLQHNIEIGKNHKIILKKKLKFLIFQLDEYIPYQS